MMEERKDFPLGMIDPNPYQPRHDEDAVAVAELADSIKRNSLLQVPTARKVGDRYQLAFGHTRKAAYALLAKTENWDEAMPLIVRDLTDLQMFEMAVAENIKRREIAWGLLYDLTSYYETASFVEVLAEYEELTKIRATKNMKKLAEQFDEEIVEAAKVVKK